MFKKLFRKLFPQKTNTDFPGGYIPNRFIMERIDDGPVLVIGDSNGRDFNPLNEKFEETYLLDVSNNNLASERYFVQRSITEKTPFPDDYFKYVVISNVLEHVWEDKYVLEEVRRILSPAGGLLFCVPLYSDSHDRHYHIYSPNTVKVIFDHAGYEIKERQFAGTMTSLPYGITAILAIVLYPFFKKGSLKRVNELVYGLHKILSKSVSFNKLVNFGGPFSIMIYAKKSDGKIDSIKAQTEKYEKTPNL